MAATDIRKIIDDGKSAFERACYADAAQAFAQAAEAYAAQGDACNAAEMRNNLSVALLKNNQASEALTAAQGTDEVFAQAGDLRRQGMAFGNQAAALEALSRLEEALHAYEHSAELLGQAGEKKLQSIVLQTVAGLKIRQGKLTDSAISMIGSLHASDKPTLLQRILKFFLRFRP